MDKPAGPTSTLGPEITAAEAMEILDDPDVIFLDVREDAERAMGFIPQSDHIPLGQVAAAADPKGAAVHPAFTAGKHLVVYCAKGGRSAMAIQGLSAMGYQGLTNLAGGLLAWHQTGGPIDR